jgi:O-antigen ligase
LVGLAYVILAVPAVSVTFSRMNYLLLPVVLLALIWQTIRGPRGRVWTIGIIGGAALVAVALVPQDQVAKRASSIPTYLAGTIASSSAADRVTSTRGFHLRVALAIFQDHPVLGVGYNHFGYHFLHTYQNRVPGRDRQWASWRSAHSSHFGILADLGLVGLVLWVCLLATSFRNLGRAKSSAVRRRYVKHVLLIRALTYSVTLQVIPYALYAPNQKSKLLWLLLGMTVIVRQLAVTTFRSSSPAADNLSVTYPTFTPAQEVRRRSRRTATWADAGR